MWLLLKLLKGNLFPASVIAGSKRFAEIMFRTVGTRDPDSKGARPSFVILHCQQKIGWLQNKQSVAIQLKRVVQLCRR